MHSQSREIRGGERAHGHIATGVLERDLEGSHVFRISGFPRSRGAYPFLLKSSLGMLAGNATAAQGAFLIVQGVRREPGRVASGGTRRPARLTTGASDDLTDACR